MPIIKDKNLDKTLIYSKKKSNLKSWLEVKLEINQFKIDVNIYKISLNQKRFEKKMKKKFCLNRRDHIIGFIFL